VTLRYLHSYAFPGNVRELENILERALAFSNGEVINVEDLGLRPMLVEASEDEPALDEERAAAPGADGPSAALPAAARAAAAVRLSADGIPESLPDYLDQLERDAIARALEKTRYNRTAAARLLGISFRALRYRMQRLGIQ
jgi:two-component system response regulator PilR (NtrC family)